MIRIYREQEQNKDFYALMGRFFASKEIAKEMDQQIYNTAGTDWYIATHRGQVQGFASVTKRNKYGFLDNLWIVPEWRGHGIGTELVETVLDDNPDVIRCIACNPYAIRILEKYGFDEVGKNGKYKRFEH